jgi:simple sugar transport system permease protein
MGYQLPELGLYSLAMMLVMLSGGIDLSIVSIGNFSGVIAATILSRALTANYPAEQMTVQIILAFFLSIVIGLVLGALNGSLIVFLKISPMLLTMATSSIITGMSIVITKGKSISGIPEFLLYFGNNTLLGIPYALWMFILVSICISFLLNRNKFGFKLKMVGSNSIAGQYSGINVKSVIIKTYMLSGLLSALCGLEILLKTNTAKADYASTYVIQAILCAVLGATNPNGGFAKVSCLVMSLLSLQFLSSGFNMLRLGGYYKDFSWGLLLMVVLSMEYFSTIIKKGLKNRMRKQ